VQCPIVVDPNVYVRRFCIWQLSPQLEAVFPVAQIE
jgi:hypothetical protein